MIRTCIYQSSHTMHTLCTAPSTLRGDCAEGQLRLANSTDDNTTQSRHGRVEICINNAWGTVCDSSNTFGPNDALVACAQLTGFQRAGAGVVTPNLPPASGPIFLDRLLCQGTESSLLNCPSVQLGVVTCTHSQDVAVRCTGELSNIQTLQIYYGCT